MNSPLSDDASAECSVPMGLPPLLVGDGAAASLLGVSRAHFLKMRASGRIDVAPVSLGRRKLYSVEKLRSWVAGGCRPCPKTG